MANTYTLLASSVLTGSSSMITFNNFNAGYQDLVIKISAKTDDAGFQDYVGMRINNLSTSIYNGRYLYGNGTTAGSGTDDNVSMNYPGYISASTNTANTFGSMEIYIPSYAISQQKVSNTYGANEGNATARAMQLTANRVATTDPITEIDLFPFFGTNFVAGSTFRLYGVFNGTGNVSPSIPTIGTATDAGTGTSVSVAFTPTSSAGVDASYTALSTPGSITAVGTASPITVTGLTTGTAYTFQVRANNPGGSSAYSAASNSVTPANPGSYYSIASQTASGSSSITFSSIPQTYKHLELRWYGVITNATQGVISLRFNSISSANYESYYGYATAGSGTTSGRASSGQTAINLMSDYSGTHTSTANSYSGIANINDYTLASRTKSVIHIAGKVGADAASSEISWGGGTINPGTSGALAAITQLVIVPLNVSTMTGTFELYGIEG